MGIFTVVSTKGKNIRFEILAFMLWEIKFYGEILMGLFLYIYFISLIKAVWKSCVMVITQKDSRSNLKWFQVIEVTLNSSLCKFLYKNENSQDKAFKFWVYQFKCQKWASKKLKNKGC